MDREVESLRSKSSRTFVNDDGSHTARVFAEPVNYRDGKGDWRPIDTDLRRGPNGHLANVANDFKIELPEELSGKPVRVQVGSNWVEFQLRGAKGAAATSGNEATYAGALPGVTVKYESEAESLKESLVLANADAPRDFSFKLDASDGLSPVLKAGTVQLREATGRVRFTLAAPYLQDAKGARSTDVSYELKPSDGGGWELGVDSDNKWLDQKDRAWPVVLDPTTYRGYEAACTIDQAQPHTSLCGTREVRTGVAADGTSTRALIKFTFDGVMPVDADILHSTMSATMQSQQGASPQQVLASAVTKPWFGPTWTNAMSASSWTTTTPWTTAGGDYASSPAPESSPMVGGAGAEGKLIRWDMRNMVQRWFDGRTATNGVLLRTNGGTASFVLANPYLEIVYARRPGRQRGFAMQTQKLSDELDLSVNSYNGNLVLDADDLKVPGGLGPDLDVSRTFNSLESGRAEYGWGWAMNTGNGVSLKPYAWDSGTESKLEFLAPGGSSHVLVHESTSGSVRTYKGPKGFDVTATYDTADGTSKLTNHQSQTVWHFNRYSSLTLVEDRNGRGIKYSYNNGIASITDSQARVTTFELNAEPGRDITKMTDSAGRVRTFGYTGNRLTSSTDAHGETTSYGYNAYGELAKITTPGGRVTLIDYEADSPGNEGRVRKVTRVTSSTSDVDPAWSFTYAITPKATAVAPSKSTVTDPNGNVTTYEFGPDAAGRPDARPTKVIDALGRTRKNTYTADANIEQYTAPNNTGSSPNTKFSFDSDGNQTGTSTLAAGGAMTTATKYGATQPGGGAVKGGKYLPTLTQNEQDTATDSSTQGTGIEYANPEGNPTTIKSTSSVLADVKLNWGTGVDGKPGQLNSTSDNRGTVNYKYDTAGNLATIDHPTVTLASSASAQPGDETLGYGAAGSTDHKLSRIARYTDGNGAITEYAYHAGSDHLARLTYRDKGGVEEARHEYDYDGDGNLVTRRDIVAGVTSTYKWSYDELGRLTREERPGPVVTTYTYDGAGNLKSLSDAGGTVLYTYDKINRLTSVQEPGAPAPIKIDTTDTTDSGTKAVTTLPNGVVTTDITDPAGRLMSTQSVKDTTTLQRFAYTYERATSAGTKQVALRSQETDQSRNVTEYSYESGTDRLKQVRTLDPPGLPDTPRVILSQYVYDYDGASNIVKRTVDGSTPTHHTHYQYNEANQLCWSATAALTTIPGCDAAPAGATKYAFEAQGNQRTESNASGTKTLEWNTRNQLVKITMLNGTASVNAYAGPGNQQRTKAGTTTTGNDAFGLAQSGNSYLTRGDQAQFLSQRVPSASAPNRRLYPLADALGSVRALTDENGGVVKRYSYDPYGRDAGTSGTGPNSVLGFAEGELDGQGLYHFGARYYDPSSGRWTQRDPLNQAADLRQANRYVYAGGDPINIADPSGLTHSDSGSAGRQRARTLSPGERQFIRGTGRCVTGGGLGAATGSKFGAPGAIGGAAAGCYIGATS